MKKDVALVLPSGGDRGLAHIGAILELEEQGYRITSIAGCSMGALIGGVYAAGKLEEFREWMKTINKKRMFELTDFSLSRYTTFDFDKSEKLIAIGRHRTQQALKKYEEAQGITNKINIQP